MILAYPHDYPAFACIADRCRHNCCIGWEIDIDDCTLADYESLEGPFGERLRASIAHTDGGTCFALDERERCPFLRADNLCEIILRLGEEALCDICQSHPRFYNAYTNRTEIGIGLSCESAARLILGRREPFRLVEEDEGEEGLLPSYPERLFLAERDRALDTATKRACSLDERMQGLLAAAEARVPFQSGAEWADFYRALERMDKSFERVIEKIALLSAEATEKSRLGTDEILFEQLLTYFLYRHYTPENGARASVAFAVHATRLLRAVAQRDGLSFEETVELCRLYSAEIEYSEENTLALMLLFDPNVKQRRDSGGCQI